MILGAFEVLVAVDRSVVLSSVYLVPFYTDPRFIFGVSWLSLVNKWSKVSDNSCRIIEKNLSTEELLWVFEIVGFESFGLGFEVVSFVDGSLILFSLGMRLCGVGCVDHGLLSALCVSIRSWFHWV